MLPAHADEIFGSERGDFRYSRGFAAARMAWRILASTCVQKSPAGGSRMRRSASATVEPCYWGSAKTYTALLPLIMSASLVILTPIALIPPPPPGMAMYWRPLIE